jgi:hypothetical protein
VDAVAFIIVADQRVSIEGTLIDHRGRRLINIDKAGEIFTIIWIGAALGRVRQPRGGNRGEKGHDIDLTVAAGFF